MALRRCLWITAACIGVTLLAASCASTDSTAPQVGDTTTTGKPKPGGRLAYGIEADPNGLDPVRNAWDPVGLLVANAIFDTWAAYDPSGQAQPYLAKKFEHNDDYTVWTIFLRDGVRFHDGEKLDADAGVKMTNAIRTSLVTGQAAVDITDVQKIDDLSFKIIMQKPWASFPAILTTQGGYVAAPAQLDDPSGFLHPIGTGPFKIDTWNPGKILRVTKNKDYWRKGLPYLDNVEFDIVDDGQTRIEGLKNGAVDVIHATNLADTTQLDRLGQSKTSNVNVVHDKGPTESLFVLFNCAVKPLDDVRVRQAIAYATDVDALAQANNWPKDRLTDSPFATDSPWYTKTDPPHNNLDKARALVAQYEAEHGRGSVKFKLSGPFETGLLQQLSDMWGRAGIHVTIDVVDIKKIVLLAVSGNYDVILFRYFAAVDPDNLWHFWSSTTTKPPGSIGLNLARLADPKVDAAIDTGRANPDPAARKQAYDDVQKRFAELVPYIWLYRTDWVIAANTKVHDVQNVTLPDGKPALPFIAGIHRLTETWIDTSS